MSEITTTQSFSDGDTVTATKLNNIQANASIQPEAITNRTAETTVDQANDLLLMYDASATALKKVSPSNLIKAGTASDFPITGNATIGGTLGVTGNASLAGTLGVTGASTLTGNTSVGGTLGVTGNTSLAGTLGVTGNVSVNTNKFNVTAASGNTTIAGTLGVSGDATLSGNLSVTGNSVVKAGTAASPAIQPTGDTNTGIFFPAADTIAFSEGGTESMRIDSSGNVGIGTSSPQRMLHISGGASDAQVIQFTSNTTGNTPNDGSVIGVASGNDFQIWNWENGYLRFGTNATERLRIDSSGRVGIGTSSPEVDLDISKSSGDVVARFRNGTGTGIVGVRSDNSFTELRAVSNHGLMFSTNNTERLRIDSSGKILSNGASNTYGGTGSLSLNAPAGSAVDLELRVNNTLVGYLYNDSTNVQLANAQAGYLSMLTNNTERLRIDSSGNVGIGTTTPSSPLDVASSNSGITLTNTGASNKKWRIGGDSSGRFLITESGVADRVLIDSSGNVGIGTTSPSYRLHVNQNVNSNSVNTQAFFQDSGSTGGTTYQHRISVTGKSGAAKIDIGTTDSSTTHFNNLACGFITGDTLPLNIGTISSNPLILSTNVTERLRITNGGEVCVGTTTAQGQFTSVRSINGSNIVAQSTNASFTDNVCLLYADRNTSNSSYNFFACTRTSVATVFAIRDSGNAVNTNNSYGAISDIKLKENIEDASSQWNDIKSIQVRKFSFKNDEEHKRMLGLVAQEVELISPHLVETVVDRDKDGNDLGTTTKEVKYSVLYMKAVKALQEAMERIEQLESKVAALEAA